MKKSKILLLTLCAVLVVTATVLGTLAFLTSQDTVVNTFSVGKVEIKLDETKVTPDGKPVDGADRVKENQYHLLPGLTYTKDPTMTVVKGSEASYVRMLVTFDHMKELDAIFAPTGADMTSIFNGYDANKWELNAVERDETANTLTYEFRYKGIVTPTATDDLVLEALFDSVTVPGFLDGEDMAAIADLKITVVGNAIQAAGFATVDAAWVAFGDQMGN